MRLVTQAENHPNVCLVTRDHVGPFVDFEVTVQDFDPHVYLSVAVVRQAAEMLGLIDAEAKAEELTTDLHSYGERVRGLESFVQAHKGLAEASEAVA